MSAKWPYFVVGVLALLGIVLIIVGGSLVAVFNDTLSKRIKSHDLPSNGSKPFQAWMNWSHFEPIYRRFYFFNVLNPQQIIETGKNVSVKELGPYVYRVNFERRNVNFNKDGSLVSYDLHKSYSFERHLSSGDEDDLVTMINLPILNLATRLRFENRTVQTATGQEVARLNESLFARVRVADALWGYKNKNLKHVLDFLDGYFHIHPLNDSTYGLLYQHGQPKQTTHLGSYVTEIGELKDLWTVKEWNGERSLNVWNSSTSNKIDGTDGYAWPPNIDESTPESLFDSEWCRSFPLTAFDHLERKIGNLSTFGYFYSNRTFSYSAGDNKGFCQPTPKQNVTCLGDGVLNTTKCKDNVPLLLSQPHFLGASAEYRDAIFGLHPNQTKHETSFNIEPMSGEVVEASRKMQLNAYVMKLTSFPNTTHFGNDETVVPVVWMDEVYSMTEAERQYLDQESSKVRDLRYKYDVIQYTLIGLGVLLLLVAIVLLVIVLLFRHRKATGEGERQPLLH